MLHVTTTEDLVGHLVRLGVTPGMRIVVHSRLLAFGALPGACRSVLDALQHCIGPEGTLVVPTYVFGQQPGEIFDPRATVSTGMGPLSEYVRQQPGACRSVCPIHSHAALGPDADRMLTLPGTVSIGPGSDFAALHAAGYTLLLLGCRFSQGATFLHHLEAVAEVPYREWISLSRTVQTTSGDPVPVSCQYYSRVATRHVREEFDRVTAWLDQAGALRRVAAPYGASFCVGLPALSDIVLSRLRTDPMALVSMSQPTGETGS
jgi:aminoglycoside N3'-acetyltransferase